MNKNYVPKVKLKPVEQMQYSQFKHHVVLNAALKSKLVSKLIAEIRSERDGNVIERSQVRQAVHMLIEVGVNSRKIYEQEFEQILLQETSDYYRAESQQLISSSSCSAYLQQANRRLQQEFERVQSYLSPSSETQLIQCFLDEYIGEVHASNLLQMESSGFVHMIRNNKINDLTIMFQLFSRRQKSFDLLKKCLSEFIASEGSKLVADTNLKTDDFIQQLMRLRELIIEIATQAMGRDSQVDLAIKMAFEKVCNQDNKVAKALVGYLDEMFKTEFKTLQEQELGEKIDKVI